MSDTVPEGWEVRSIGDLVTLQYGKSPKEVMADDGQYPVIGTGGVTGYASSYLYDGCTTVIGRKGTINKPSYVEGKFWAIDTTYFCTGYKAAEPKWFYYSLNSFDLSRFNEASGVPSLGRDTLNAIPLLTPPLPEQQKIAAILSSVDGVVEKTRAQIDKLKDLKTGMMQELLTKGIGSGGVPHTEFKDSPVGKIPVSWQTAAMGEIFDFKNGVNKDKTAFGHGVPIISYKNVYVGGGIVDSNINSLVEMNDQELNRFRVNYGDVFFTRTSETPDEIGFTNVYLGSRNNVVFNGFVIRGRQKSNVFDPCFLKYVFQSNVVRKQMMDNSKFTTRAGISGESLGRITLAIPDIPEQQVITSHLDSIQNRIDRVRNKLMVHESLKKALMQDLLTGKVRVSQKESAVA